MKKRNGIGKLTINRPEKMNALTGKTTDEIARAMLDGQQDRNVEVVVITGAGDKAFCSGGDVSSRDPDTGAYGGGGEPVGASYGELNQVDAKGGNCYG